MWQDFIVQRALQIPTQHQQATFAGLKATRSLRFVFLAVIQGTTHRMGPASATSAQVVTVVKEREHTIHCHAPLDTTGSSMTPFPASNAQRASGMLSMGIPWKISASHALKAVCVELKA